MLPATTTSRPAARKTAPSSSHVVDFPFVPVTPTKRVPVGASRRQPSSSSDQTGTPAVRAARTSGAPAGTPGLFTTSSTPSSSEPDVLVPECPVDGDHLVAPLAETLGCRRARAGEAVDEHPHLRLTSTGLMFG